MGSTHESAQSGKVEMRIGVFTLYSETPFVWLYTISEKHDDYEVVSELRTAPIDMACLLEQLVGVAKIPDSRASNATALESPSAPSDDAAVAGTGVALRALKAFEVGVDLAFDPSGQHEIFPEGQLSKKKSAKADEKEVFAVPAHQRGARVVTPPPQVQKLREHTERQRQQEATMRQRVELVFAYWAEIMGHTHTLLDSKREKRIEARLRENNGNVGELLYAIDGAAKDDWIMGRDPRSSKKYDGIETVLRDRAQVEKFAQAIPRYRRGETHPLLEKGE